MVGETVKSNVKERIEAITIIPNNAADVLSELVEGITNIRPVQGLMNAAMKAGDGAFAFVSKQAEITRRWAGKVS